MTLTVARLAEALRSELVVEEEADGGEGLTVRHDATVASLRVVGIAQGLEIVSLTQVLAWDIPLNQELCEVVSAQARALSFGALILTGLSADGAVRPGAEASTDVLLRYNFPGSGLTDDALRTLVLLVLDGGARARRMVTT